MVAALERQGAEVRLMGAVDCGAFWLPRVKHHFYKRLMGRTYLQGRDQTVLQTFAWRIEMELLRSPDVDCVLTPFSATVAYLKTHKRVALWHDATFESLLDYYPGYERSTLCAETLRSGNAAEGAAIRRADVLIYTSEWAARSAIVDYGADPAKVKVIPYGSNLVDLPTDPQAGEIIARRRLMPVRFLFIGGEWSRKGGDVAFEIVQQLNKGGIAAELLVVGALPQGPAATSPLVHTYGRLNKKNPVELGVLRNLFETASFFLLPSGSDCTPIVFCEANAFGLPVISTLTGGIPSLIKDGVNGKLFDLPSMVAGVCDYVRKLMAVPQQYAELCQGSFRESQHRLNWDASTCRVIELLAAKNQGAKAALNPHPAGAPEPLVPALS